MVDDGRSRGYLILIGGDWNAEIGRRQQGEDPLIVSDLSQGIRNERGDWFAKWAKSNAISIATLSFHASMEDTWTHIYDGRKR
eukprot:6641504-Karenia_brevis.AAC.1